jgi:PAS domain S-box-containing protein
MENQSDWDFEYRIRRVDGQIRWIRASGRHTKDAAGASGRMTGIVQDITERKLVEETLRESEEKFRMLFENMAEGVALHEMIRDDTGTAVDYRVLAVNSAYVQQTGIPRETATNSLASELYKTSMPPYLAEYEEVVESGKPSLFETYFPPMEKYFTISVICIKPNHFATVFLDISERKKAEEEAWRLLAEAQEEKERLSALVNSIQDEVWFADTEKRFTLANPSALREFNLKENNGIDIQKFAESLEIYRADGSPRPVDEAPSLHALKGEVVKNQEEMIRTPGSREMRYREVSASPVRDAHGTIIGSIAVVRDITERKRADEALQENRVKLKAAFASMMEAIFIADAEGRLIDFNEEFVRYHRFKNREECSRTIADCSRYLAAYFGDGTVAPPEMWAMPRALRGETASDVE